MANYDIDQVNRISRNELSASRHSGASIGLLSGSKTFGPTFKDKNAGASPFSLKQVLPGSELGGNDGVLSNKNDSPLRKRKSFLLRPEDVPEHIYIDLNQ